MIARFGIYYLLQCSTMVGFQIPLSWGIYTLVSFWAAIIRQHVNTIWEDIVTFGFMSSINEEFFINFKGHQFDHRCF